MSTRNFGDQFVSKDFSPEKYVNEINSQCVGGSELNSEKVKLQALSDDTHSALKKNVFQHYEQFIDTAKDISYLAGEMYQISQMLRDQKNLIQNILDTSILASKKNPAAVLTPTEVTEVKSQKPAEDESRKKLLSVLEKVEGAAEVVEDDGRTLIFEGDLLEINPDNYSAVQRKRGYLFNDGIMLAVWVTNRRGPQRYKFEAFYDLGSIGLVVNIRDPECPKHTFKLLIFPSVHLLQCPNQQEKDSWVNQIETNQKILRNPAIGGMVHKSKVDSPTQENNPGFPSFESERTKSPEESMAGLSLQHSFPEWVTDIPEDLDVWIAQRNFTEAVDLYDSFKEFLEHQPLTLSLREIKAKVDSRIKGLIDILVGDLEIMTPEKILQGGPRSIRKSIDLLVRLGRENQASQLFLSHRSAYIKNRLKRLKTEGRSQLYMDHMAVIFFAQITETIKEYRRSFNSGSVGIAGLVVWVNSETSSFITSFGRQLFTPQSHLSDVATSVAKVRYESQKLTDLGMDVSCVVDSLLLSHIERTVADAKDKLVEAVRHRYKSQDEVGIPMKFSDKETLQRTFNELADLGVTDLKSYVKGGTETSLQLSSNTISFAKSWLHFCYDVMQLAAPEWQTLTETAICEVILVELKHLEHALARARKKKDSKVVDIIERDAVFVLDVVCKAANGIYEKALNQELPELTVIVEEYVSLKSKKPQLPPVVINRVSKPMYTSPEYI